MGNLVKASWNGGMSFDIGVTGHSVVVDADVAVGGENKGAKPKPLLLAALAGCTGMDVASLMRKMRQDVSHFAIDIEANMTDEHPKYYNKIHIKYIVKGKGLELSKIEKAIDLSLNRYCGVSFMLGKTAEITHEIIIEE